MGNLVQAELRKTTTTGLWWGLLIPTAVLALGWGLATGLFGKFFVDFASTSDLEEVSDFLGVTPDQWKVTLFGMARAINISTIFPMVFGAMAISGEINRRTITTTFLTAPSRMHAMLAKMLVYVLWGAIYGLAIMLFLGIGVVLTSSSGQLPDAGGWAMLALACVLSSILMTMFGVGVGALIPNVAGTIVLLLLYFLVIENVLHFVLAYLEVPTVIGFLPNGSINGLTGSVAVDLFLSSAGVVPPEVEDVLRAIAGAGGALDWWWSGLVFLGWAGVVFAGGWAVTQSKDIT
ncbi:ABC transporter permease subunit [Lentzea flava]|uniref:ABC transporter permease n=1 Tax=Lentzea flava TaxID=103732 RepID=A0ABQ2V0V2_9PSEU|nr:ABC transporter permease subunit [Lentzea flava]MCP2202891.1 ABC-2 type transport system permease protein [Lentzea flava]GGU62923.1 ABC transporter permease [Lentzea flava]